MKKHHLVAMFLAQTVLACGVAHDSEEQPPPPLPPVESEERVEPPKPIVETVPDPLVLGVPGTSEELLAALARGEPAVVVLKVGTKLGDGTVIGAGDQTVARAVRLVRDKVLAVELLRAGADVDVEVALGDVVYLKSLDEARLGEEITRATTTAVGELEDYDVDEAMRRVTVAKGILPLPAPLPAKDFDCIARFAQISASRDFLPFPLTNCSAPQDPVGDPERIADAVAAKKVAQNLFDKALAEYNNAQAMIAALQARMVAIQNAYVFIRTDSHFKEYNLSHFKDFLHGRKDYNDRYDRAEKLLVAAALATQAQIAAYSQVPPPSAAESRSEANRLVARKWNCVLHAGLLNNGGRSGSTVVGTTLETAGAPFVDIQVMLDDHPPLPQKDGWGGIFLVGATPNLATDVTRLAVAGFVPVRASAGLPIVMFRFQPLDAKKTRPVGKACNLRAGIVL